VKNVPGALGKQIILPIYMDHAVLQHALPFVFHAGHL
jgi:hypothetical protein